MQDCFRYAKVYRVVMEYFLDSDPAQKYKISFASLDAAHSWLGQPRNHNKSVSQMLLRYDYPEQKNQ